MFAPYFVQIITYDATYTMNKYLGDGIYLEFPMIFRT